MININRLIVIFSKIKISANLNKLKLPCLVLKISDRRPERDQMLSRMQVRLGKPKKHILEAAADQIMIKGSLVFSPDLSQT